MYRHSSPIELILYIMLTWLYYVADYVSHYNNNTFSIGSQLPLRTWTSTSIPNYHIVFLRKKNGKNPAGNMFSLPHTHPDTHGHRIHLLCKWKRYRETLHLLVNTSSGRRGLFRSPNRLAQTLPQPIQHFNRSDFLWQWTKQYPPINKTARINLNIICENSGHYCITSTQSSATITT